MGTTKNKQTKSKETKEDLGRGPERILVVGAAGYVGRMICDLFCSAPDVREIVAIDAKPVPELLKRKKKLTWIESDLCDEAWKSVVDKSAVDIAIYAAWDFSLGKENLLAIERFFEFAFLSPSIKKIIYLSSILPYGAVPDNSRARLFAEGEILRESEYSHAVFKKDAESVVARLYGGSNRTKNVFVLRLGVVWGPLAKTIGETSDPLMKMFGVLPYIFDPGEDYGIQFVHEDDLIDLVAILTFNRIPLKGYEVFNVVAKDIVGVDELASFFDKWVLKMPSLFINLFAMFFGSKYNEDLSKRGAWRFLSFPVFADNSKLSKKLKFDLIYSGKDAIEGRTGRYDYLLAKERIIEAGKDNRE